MPTSTILPYFVRKVVQNTILRFVLQKYDFPYKTKFLIFPTLFSTSKMKAPNFSLSSCDVSTKYIFLMTEMNKKKIYLSFLAPLYLYKHPPHAACPRACHYNRPISYSSRPHLAVLLMCSTGAPKKKGNYKQQNEKWQPP